MYQVMMRECFVDTATMQTFNVGMICKNPVGAPDKLGSSTFPIGVSFIYGDADPLRGLEEDGPQKVVDINPNPGCKVHICPETEHNMHQENPKALVNIMLKDLLGEDNTVEPPSVPQQNFEE